MSKVRIHTEVDTKILLEGVVHLKLKELEDFARELNAIITRKKSKNKLSQDKILLEKINNTTIDEDKKNRFLLLAEKMKEESISEQEHQEYLRIVEEQESIRNERVKYLIELSQLRAIPLPQLMIELGLTTSSDG